MSSDQYASELIQPNPAEISTWRATRQDSQLVAEGPCPHCSHDCLIEIRERVQLGGVASAIDDGAGVEAVPRRMLCNCERHHAERPESVLSGCGRFWMAVLVPRQDGGWRVRPFEDKSLFPALTELASDQESQDTRIRAGAEKWLAAITALCGLFSIAGVATAKDATTGLSAWSKFGVAAAVVTVLGCAGTAIVIGYMAAYGWPSSVDVRSPDQIREWYKARRMSAQRAASKLRLAVILACVTLGLLALVMMLLWFLPRSPTIAVDN